MSLVILQPHSETNHSDRYAVVEFEKWQAYTNGETPALEVVKRFDTYDDADIFTKRNNAKR